MKFETAEFVRSAYAVGDFVNDKRPQVAFAGRSNVGKSSLINRLLGRKNLARTSSTPGRTRCVNYYLVNRRFYLVDLPGYGYAKVARHERRQWGHVVDDYLAHSAPSLGVILLIDGKVGGTSLDVQAFEYLTGLGIALIVAVTKIDRVPRHQRVRRLAAVGDLLGIPEGVPSVGVSAKSGEGITDLVREISARSESGHER